ncbi:Delta-1-pyrroline-5-carboxylate dehydrogenase 12A1 [Citrus sinensis]|uniref:Delta-1-pyrroline-5-carboxylate dehydrogenase 12A1 n=1 Tax=Citrus sinensis TaxID=2711 RepID=A0ACB8J0U9_CITSI|nr:Delta-1-pyrroline-5-carboxylate dehydrogenase 12A1 [Citrus sinensis]
MGKIGAVFAGFADLASQWAVHTPGGTAGRVQHTGDDFVGFRRGHRDGGVAAWRFERRKMGNRGRFCRFCGLGPPGSGSCPEGTAGRDRHTGDDFGRVRAGEISGSKPGEVYNLVQGKWTGSSNWSTLLDPLNGEQFIRIAEVGEKEIQPFVESLSKCPKHGLHNPFKSPERYLLYGDISTKAAHMLSLPKVSNFFTRLIQRVSPKSYQQALGEVQVTQKFLENFCGDQVRFLARLFAVPGNHLGQQSHGYRWPYGPVAIITPFNFPLEIPVLQLMGALYMGNKPILKVDSKVSIVMEQMMRLLHYCGLPVEDVDFINSDGKTMNKLLMEANPRMTLFTGSSRVAEKLAVDLKGRVKLEDAGFDWKILGPDVNEVAYVSWVCDQDAYACSGQKCSAQSVLFMHENWSSTSLLSKMKDLADRRKLEDLTVGPVLTLSLSRTSPPSPSSPSLSPSVLIAKPNIFFCKAAHLYIIF